MNELLQRFLRYVSIETTSNENSDTQPSTACQLELLKLLRNELQSMGISAELDEFGYVMATIPANKEGIPAIGFIAHVDTSPDASGKDIKPNIIENYNGETILLNSELNIQLSPTQFPELLQYVGQTIITTGGTTLLGADDKAGVAEIMTAAAYLMNHPELPHGEIKIAFTPDEEIGRGVVKFDVKKFGSTYAYTIDGGEIGELEYENFNAAAAEVTIEGMNIHPGYAKGRMINSQLVAHEFISQLPENQRPESTEGREGFIHLTYMQGSVEKTELHFIIRDHDEKLFMEKQEILKKIASALNTKYGDIVHLTIRHQYSNMKQMIEPHMHIVEIARKAMEEANIKPKIQPIRGGTDGANLSFKGLPCPNIFAGGHNFHGRFEYIPLQSMEKAVEVILNIVKEFAHFPIK